MREQREVRVRVTARFSGVMRTLALNVDVPALDLKRELFEFRNVTGESCVLCTCGVCDRRSPAGAGGAAPDTVSRVKQLILQFYVKNIMFSKAIKASEFYFQVRSL
jgi:hypothetical protein